MNLSRLATGGLRYVVANVVGVSVALASAGSAVAQVRSGSTNQAPYSEGQADAGERLYRDECSSCHLATLQGTSEAPQLVGPNFRAQWGGRPVREFLAYLRSSMPPRSTGSLDENQYASVAAYLLRANGVEPGPERLSFASAGSSSRVSDVRPHAARGELRRSYRPLLAAPGPGRLQRL